MNLRSKFKQIAMQAEDQVMATKDALDRLNEVVAEKLEDLETLEHRIRQAQENYEAEKDVSSLYI